MLTYLPKPTYLPNPVRQLPSTHVPAEPCSAAAKHPRTCRTPFGSRQGLHVPSMPLTVERGSTGTHKKSGPLTRAAKQNPFYRMK